MKKLAIFSSTFISFLLAASPAAAQVNLIIPSPAILKITDIGKFISNILAAVLVIAALAAFVFLLLGGLQWITSGGDKAGVEAAQKRIQAAIIGLFVVFAAWAIMLLIGKFLGIDNIFNLSIPTKM